MTAAERRFATTHRVARLATADTAAAPHVVPICYALLGELFYFVIDDKPKRTHNALKRLRNIRQNPQVALVIDDYADDWDQLAYLLVQGEAGIVDERAEFARALQALRRRYAPYRSMDIQFATHPLVRIRPIKTHFWAIRR